MASETIKCPHCECKVSISEVEKEDGFCPECGQLVMGSTLFDDFDDEDDLMEGGDGDYDYDEDDMDRDDDEYDDEYDDDGYERDILDELTEELNDEPLTRSSKRKRNQILDDDDDLI